jgi:hypothetical protein
MLRPIENDNNAAKNPFPRASPNSPLMRDWSATSIPEITLATTATITFNREGEAIIRSQGYPPSMRNSMLGVGFLVVFGIVVTTYPSYANNDVVVFAVVAGMLALGLAGIVLSGRPGKN